MIIEKKLNHLLIFFLLIMALSSIAVVGETHAEGLIIEDITFEEPHQNCDYKWKATVFNDSNTNYSGLISLQGYQGNSTNWFPATGTSISSLAPHTRQTATGKWQRKGDMTQLKVVAYYQGNVINEKIIQLPGEDQISLDVESGDFRANGYSINIKNSSTIPVADFTFQCSMASNINSQWIACGGHTIECINSQSTINKNYNRSINWNAGMNLYKITINRGSQKLVEKTFDTSPNASASSPNNAMTLPTGQTKASDLNTRHKNTLKFDYNNIELEEKVDPTSPIAPKWKVQGFEDYDERNK